MDVDGRPSGRGRPRRRVEFAWGADVLLPALSAGKPRFDAGCAQVTAIPLMLARARWQISVAG